MKLIVTNNQCRGYYDAAVTYVFDGDDIIITEHGNESYITACPEDQTTVYVDPAVPDDFTCYKYDFDGTNFTVSADFEADCERKRTKRNTLLAETDWWSCSDRTMSQAEIDYRQALRDIPQQEGFPMEITWPTKP